MMPRAARVAVLAAMGAIASPTAQACSMVAGYKVPTNLELAAKAETIVVAEVTGERPGADEWSGAVLARPTLLLKGDSLPGQVEIGFAALSSDSRMVIASDPRELRRPNPAALMGSCVRYGFAPGMKLVLFLVRDKEGRLVPFRSAFSRDSEDVPGEDALWVKAVREYARIAEAPRDQWDRRLRARAAELRAIPSDADAMAIAADMDVERSGRRQPPFD